MMRAMTLRWPLLSRQQPWHPTPQQRATADRLADHYVGAYVQTRPDGNADLRTVDHGEIRHYLISRDGATTLVTAEVRTWRHPMGYGLLITGGFLTVVMAVTLVVAQLTHFRTEAELGWAAGLCGTGLVFGFVGQTLLTSQPRPPGGETWEYIGGADF